MNISTVNALLYMTYDSYINQPLHAIELKLNMNIAKNQHLINSPSRNYIHPLIGKYSQIDK